MRQRTILASLISVALLTGILVCGVLNNSDRRERIADVWQRIAIRFDIVASRLLPSVRVRLPPTRIGINLSSPTYWTDERSFTNLALAGGWQVDRGQLFHLPATTDFRPDGTIRPDPTIRRLAIYLTRPLDPVDPWIECRYSGTADLTVHGDVESVVALPAGLRFRWHQTPKGFVWLIAQKLDPRRPLTALDCREDDTSHSHRFVPEFVTFVRRFAAVRFMGWQRANDNLAVTWATRHTPRFPAIATGDGVSIEDMVALTTDAGADPWFTMPWNASDDYIIGFATYVRDHLPRDRAIYVETGNEVWNTGFPVARQAIREGLARGLSRNPTEAGLRRYAERTIEVMRLWERVFAHEPGRLVRIASTQQANPRSARIVFAWPGLADHVDALATADYFGIEGGAATGDALPPIFARLNQSMAGAIQGARDNKAVATHYGKRYLAYEAGQSVSLWGREPLVARIERSPSMYGLYSRYLDAWRRQIGDTVMLLGSTAPLNHEGWGLREFSGQRLENAPKLRAVFDALGCRSQSRERGTQPTFQEGRLDIAPAKPARDQRERRGERHGQP